MTKENLRNQYIAYRDNSITKEQLLTSVKDQIKSCDEVIVSLQEPLYEGYIESYTERKDLLAIVLQLKVKLEKEVENINNDNIVWKKAVADLFEQYSKNKFNKTSFTMDNFYLPYNTLDVNLWIRSGTMATAMNDMLWNRLRSYSKGDVVCMYIDQYMYAKNYTKRDGNVSIQMNNPQYQFEQYKHHQGRFLYPVYFVCTRSNTNESPFNKNWCYIPCLTAEPTDPVAMIPYAAVYLDKLICINNTFDCFSVFNTEFFTNNTYWKCINNYYSIGGARNRGKSIWDTSSLDETICYGNITTSSYSSIPDVMSLFYGFSPYTLFPFYVWACGYHFQREPKGSTYDNDGIKPFD
uniref:hypothetical protein n=1 Tax=Methanobrevibacter sp. TaxID=66852 RepID=UPI003D7DDAD8